MWLECVCQANHDKPTGHVSWVLRSLWELKCYGSGNWNFLICVIIIVTVCAALFWNYGLAWQIFSTH
jgi:hypothetical protein